MSRKIILSLVFLGVLFFGLIASEAKAVSVKELQDLISKLQTQVNALRLQLPKTTNVSSKVWCHDFKTDLKYGMTGADTTALKTALEKEGFYEKSTSSLSFDEEVASAVIGFQQKYKDEILTSYKLRFGTGFVGTLTRNKLNKLYGCNKPDPLKSITVSSPNGGESLTSSKSYKIIWQGTGELYSKLNILLAGYEKEGSQIDDWQIISTDVKSNQGYYYWTPAGAPLYVPSKFSLTPDKYKIKIMEASNKTDAVGDVSDNYFTISTDLSSSTCIDYDGGKDYYMKGTTTNGFISESDSCYNKNSGWIISCSGNDCGLKEYYCGADNKVYVDLNYSACPYGCQDGACIRATTTKPFIMVLSPGGGEKLETGKTYDIVWSATGINEINIDLLKGTTTQRIANVSATSGRYAWKVEESIPADDYEIMVWSGGKTEASDKSEKFSIISLITCSDSDGKDYYKKGICTSKFGSFADTCDSNSIREYSCSLECVSCSVGPNAVGCVNKACDQICNFEYYNCPYGCKDGACVKF
jgi:hypothetical protein